MERNRHLDLLRPVAIGAVVYGHWLLADLTYSGARFSYRDALGYVGWGQWLTWAFQVMPVFFLVGGYANALSWTTHHARGESWTWWIQRRAMRLWWPTAVYLGAGALAVVAAGAAGTARANIAVAGRVVTLQLWFLPVYLVLIALTPVMFAAHRRWGLAVPAGMAAAAALVSTGVTVPHLRLLGYANYLLVWGAIHQCGFAWRDGTLTRPRWRAYALAGGGAALLAGLAASLAGLSLITIAGLAPRGHLPGIALAACTAGLAATLCSGRDPAAAAKPQALSPQQPLKAA
jgi:fucose 4-O-acetylase-like acetyltransferase